MSNGKPKLVGITGGIGSGKSTAAKIFSILGIPIYYADDRAKWLMQNNADLVQKIKDVFGSESYQSDGSLDRVYLAKHVFGDAEKLAQINALVHPVVGNDFNSWAEKQHTSYVLKEAALLFETGSYQKLFKTINVSAPLKLRITRILMRDPHRTEEQINAIIDKQMPDEEKNKLADFVIKNGDNKLLITQVIDIHKRIVDTVK